MNTNIRFALEKLWRNWVTSGQRWHDTYVRLLDISVALFSATQENEVKVEWSIQYSLEVVLILPQRRVPIISKDPKSPEIFLDEVATVCVWAVWHLYLLYWVTRYLYSCGWTGTCVCMGSLAPVSVILDGVISMFVLARYHLYLLHSMTWYLYRCGWGATCVGVGRLSPVSITLDDMISL